MKILAKKRNIHFIGIGGIGMSGIAEILHDMKFSVSGSDINENNKLSFSVVMFPTTPSQFWFNLFAYLNK